METEKKIYSDVLVLNMVSRWQSSNISLYAWFGMKYIAESTFAFDITWKIKIKNVSKIASWILLILLVLVRRSDCENFEKWRPFLSFPLRIPIIFGPIFLSRWFLRPRSTESLGDQGISPQVTINSSRFLSLLFSLAPSETFHFFRSMPIGKRNPKHNHRSSGRFYHSPRRVRWSFSSGSCRSPRRRGRWAGWPRRGWPRGSSSWGRARSRWKSRFAGNRRGSSGLDNRAGICRTANRSWKMDYQMHLESRQAKVTFSFFQRTMSFKNQVRELVFV